MSGYFDTGADREMLEKAAHIVALVLGRESATRTDYAHPRLREIQRILDDIARRERDRVQRRVATP